MNMDERTGRPEQTRRGLAEGEERAGAQGERSGPSDPTRKLLKVFGVKVTDYEAKTEALLTRWAEASPADRAEIAREAAELSADLAHWLREVQTHVLDRQERVLAAVAAK
jgi:hypothetical protein